MLQVYLLSAALYAAGSQILARSEGAYLLMATLVLIGIAAVVTFLLIERADRELIRFLLNRIVGR